MDEDPTGKHRPLPAALPQFGLAEDILRAAAAPTLTATAAALPGTAVASRAPAAAPGGALMDFLRTLPGRNEQEAAEPPEPPVQLVSIELCGELYGIEIHLVQEVIRVGTITRVPGAPTPILGITSLRGKILPVLDLRKRLALPASELGARSRIVVVELRGKLLGLLVDAVHQVLPIPAQSIEPPPEGGELLGGVAQLPAGRLIILLELERLLDAAGAPGSGESRSAT